MKRDFGASRITTAAEQHKCIECDLVIEIGDEYMRHWGRWEGDKYVEYQCVPCGELFDKAKDAAEEAGYSYYADETPCLGFLKKWLADFKADQPDIYNKHFEIKPVIKAIH